MKHTGLDSSLPRSSTCFRGRPRRRFGSLLTSPAAAASSGGADALRFAARAARPVPPPSRCAGAAASPLPCALTRHLNQQQDRPSAAKTGASALRYAGVGACKQLMSGFL